MSIKNIVFIDSRVAGQETLIAGLAPDSGYFLLNDDEDGVAQMQRIAAQYRQLDSIQVLSHGSAGAVLIGNTRLDDHELERHHAQLQALGASLAPGGDLLLYGCDVAQGELGMRFIRSLAEASGADVAASSDLTGAAGRGGNWVLEESTGTIDAAQALGAPAKAAWDGSLAWYDTLADGTLKNLIVGDLSDNSFSYQEMLDLFSSAAVSGVSGTEYRDLTTFQQNAASLFSSDYLRYISNAVISGNPANQTWWGGSSSRSATGSVGNLAAGSSETVAERLIDEWFKGLDLPMPVASGTAYAYSTASGNLFVNGVAAADINQGRLGDCYLLSSLGAIANIAPGYIYNAFTDNGNGSYGVKFYVNDQPIYTTVNGSLPTLNGRLSFAGNAASSLSGETWVSLFEKAYVQANAQYNLTTEADRANNYDVIQGGWAYPIREITGLSYRYYSSFYNPSDSLATATYVSANSSTYKDSIITALNAGAVAWLGSFGNSYDGSGKQEFVSGHAFMILGYNAATDLFTIRNPWGGTGGNSYLPEFQARIEDFWNSNIKGVVAVSDTAADHAAPSLAALSPADNAGNVLPSANLVLEFNEAVKAGSGNILIYNGAGSVARTIAVTDTAQVSFSGHTLTINPVSNLAAAANYYVVIGAGVVQDLAGNAFAGLTGPAAYNFTTTAADTTGPTLSSLSPADNATGVAVGSNLVLSFSEAVVAGSGNILLWNGNGTLARTIAVSDATQVTVSGNTVTINPATDLGAGSSYYVTLAAGVVRDLAGNAFAGLSGATAFNFTTAGGSSGDDYANGVTDTSAPIGSLAVGSSATGIIETGGDHDLFRVTLNAGTTYNLELKGADSASGTLSDPYLRLRDSAGNAVAFDDDGGTGTDSLLAFTPTSSGAYYLDAAHYGSGSGSYQVRVSAQADTTAPTLVGLSPADNASAVAVNSNFVLSFSEAVAAGSGNILICNGNGTVARTIAVSDSSQVTLSGNTLTINPATDLSPGSSYYLTLAAGVVRDLAGNAFAGLSGATAWNFATAASVSDDCADSVTDTSAPIGSIAVGSSATGTIETAGDHDLFRVTLNAGTTYTLELKGADSASGTLADPYLRLLDSAGTLLAYDDDSGSGGDSLLSFTPTAGGAYYLDAAHFGGGTGSYQLRVSGQADSTAPTLSSLSPADNASGVAVNSKLVLGFSEAVATGSGDILIWNGNGTLARTIAVTDAAQVTVSGNTLTIDPGTDLSPASSYYVTLAAGVVHDLAGNAFAGLADATAFNFTTVASASDDYADSVSDTSAPIGSVAVGSSTTGAIETAGDHDLFRVALSAGTTYTFELKGSDSASGTLSDPCLRLRDSAGTQVASNDDSGSGSDSLLTFTPTTSGAYYIDAAHYTASSEGLFVVTGSYTVSVGTRADTVAPTLSSLLPADNATAVAVGSNLVLTFSEAVRAESGNINVFNGDGTLARTISVTDASQVNISGNTVVIDPVQDLAASSNYYVTIGAGVITDVYGNAFAGLSGATAYNFSTRGTDDYADSVTDRTAPIGSLAVGGSATGNIETAGDHDLFRVTLTAGTAYAIELKGADSASGTLSDPTLRLLNSAGTRLASNDDGGSGADSLLAFTPTASGSYYLDAAHFGSGTGSYQVRISGDTTFPTLLSLSPADNAVAVAENSNLVLTFSEAVSAGSGNIVLHNGNGTVARTIAVTDSAQVTVSGNTVTINPATDLSAGSSYYVTLAAGVVRDLAGHAFAGLGTTTAWNFSTRSTDDYADSVTDSSAPKGSIAVGGSVTGNIESAGDHDLFRVTLNAGATCSFELKGADSASGTLSDPYLRLLNSAGTLVAYDDDGGSGADSLLSFTPTTSGTYYLDAAHYGVGTGSYQLRVGGDTTAPTLLGVSPADNTTEVAVNSNLMLSFSEAVAVGSGSIQICNGNGTVARSIAVTDASQVTLSGNTLTINPATDLSAGSSYYVTLAAGVVHDLAGNAFAGLSGTTAWNFSTRSPDDYANSVTDTSAPIGSLAVGGSATGRIGSAGDHDLFRVALTAGVRYTLEQKGADSASGTLSDPSLRVLNSAGTLLAYDDDGGVGFDSFLTFTPTTTGSYYLDAAHHDSGTGSYQLRVTGDTTAPTLLGVSPADNASQVAVNSNLVLSFSEAVAAGSGSIQICNGNGTVARSIAVTDAAQVTLSGNTLTINPATDLSAGSSYYVTLAAGVVHDLAGNAFAGLGSATAFNFTTVANVSDDYADNVTDTSAPIGSLAVGGSATGVIETAGDHDLFRVSLTAGTTYALELKGASSASGTLFDPYLRLFNSVGTQVSYDDDGGFGLDSLVSFRPTTSGYYYLDAAHLSSGTGSYQVAVSPRVAAAPSLGDAAPADKSLVLSSLASCTLADSVENGRITSTGTASLIGNALANTLQAGPGSNLLDGRSGTDTVSYLYGLVDGATTGVRVSLAAPLPQATGSSGWDTLIGIENLVGSSLGDTLSGNGGNNVLCGGLGKDFLSGRGGKDSFVFTALADSGITAATRDTISDFNAGDRLDLSALDANTDSHGVNDAFSTLTVGGSFSGSLAGGAGSLYFDAVDHMLYGNVDGDAAADFSIELTGVTQLGMADFVL